MAAPKSYLTSQNGVGHLFSPGDCVGVDRKLVAKRTDAGQQLPRPKRLFSDGQFDLPNNLLVNRDPAGRVDGKEHGDSHRLNCRAGVPA